MRMNILSCEYTMQDQQINEFIEISTNELLNSSIYQIFLWVENQSSDNVIIDFDKKILQIKKYIIIPNNIVDLLKDNQITIKYSY